MITPRQSYMSDWSWSLFLYDLVMHIICLTLLPLMVLAGVDGWHQFPVWPSQAKCIIPTPDIEASRRPLSRFFFFVFEGWRSIRCYRNCKKELRVNSPQFTVPAYLNKLCPGCIMYMYSNLYVLCGRVDEYYYVCLFFMTMWCIFEGSQKWHT